MLLRDWLWSTRTWVRVSYCHFISFISIDTCSSNWGVWSSSNRLSFVNSFFWQEFVQFLSFSEDFDAVHSRFESFFDHWGFLECPDFQIAESGDEKHASRKKNDVKNKLEECCSGVFLQPARFFLLNYSWNVYLHSDLWTLRPTVFFKAITNNFDKKEMNHECWMVAGNAGH